MLVNNRGWVFAQDKQKLGHEQGDGRMGDGRQILKSYTLVMMMTAMNAVMNDSTHQKPRPLSTSVKAMSKRTQEDANEERVTAKSRPMTNLVSRCRVWDPTVLASTASEKPVNTKS